MVTLPNGVAAAREAEAAAQHLTGGGGQPQHLQPVVVARVQLGPAPPLAVCCRRDAEVAGLAYEAALEQAVDGVDVHRLREGQRDPLTGALLAVPAALRRRVEQVLTAVLAAVVVEHAAHTHAGHQRLQGLEWRR